MNLAFLYDREKLTLRLPDSALVYESHFPEHIRKPGFFVKDQWQFQMHCRTLAKLGEENLRFVTAGLREEQLKKLSVNPFAVPCDAVQATIQKLIEEAVAAGKTIAVFPEGSYCAPVSK